MAVKSLKRSFPIVKDDERSFYGGTQEWSRKKYVRGYGCGTVACANVLKHTVDRKGPEVSKGEYIDYTKHLRHFYLPIIPKFGMNGLFMALGMNVYFLRKRLPFRARCGCLSKNIFKHIEEMLDADIPVVLAAGPNWPNLFGKHRLNMYEFLGGQYVVTASMRAHYVTVTAMDDEYMTISSWGKKFYIKRDEFMEYAGKHSNFLFSSILVIKAGK